MLEGNTRSQVRNILKRMKKKQYRLDNLTAKNGNISMTKLTKWFVTYHPGITQIMTIQDIKDIAYEVGLEVVDDGQ